VNAIGIIKLGLLGILLFIPPVYVAIHHVSWLHFHTVQYSDSFFNVFVCPDFPSSHPNIFYSWFDGISIAFKADRTHIV